MRKKIVIFGAGGTLGLYLVDHLSRLLSADEWEVIASGRSDIAFFDRYAPLVRYVQADITDEKSFAALPQQDVMPSSTSLERCRPTWKSTTHAVT